MAGNAGGIRAGRAFVEIGANDSSLVAGLKAAEAKLKAFGAGLTGVGTQLATLGAAITAPLLGAAKVFADAGSDLNDMSARTGVSVEALSALGHAAAQTGSDLETVEGGVRKLQKNLAAAATGSTETAAVFGALGLSVRKLIRLSPDEQFAAVANALAKIPNPAVKAATTMQLLGKSGTALLPMIDNLDELTKEARDFGLVWTGDEADAADKLGDSLDLLVAVGKRVVTVIGSALAPTLTELAGSLAAGSKRVMDWVKDNGELIATAFKVGVAVTAAGAALVVLGVGISGLGAVLGGIATGIGVVGTVLAALVSPVGLVVAALVGAGVAFFKFTDAGQKSLEWLGGKFGELKDSATTAFKGIGDALAAGDVALAGKILWTGLRIEWLKGVAFLKSAWAGWKDSAVAVFEGFTATLGSLMTDVLAELHTQFVQVTGFIGEQFGAMVAGLQSLWVNFSAFFSKALVVIKGGWLSALDKMGDGWSAFALGVIKAAHPLGKLLVSTAQKSQVDAAAEFKRIDDDAAAAQKAIEERQGASATGGRQSTQEQVGAIESDRQAAQQALADQQAAAAAERLRAMQEAQAGDNEALAQAKADLAEALAEAAKKREALAGPAGDKGPAPGNEQGDAGLSPGELDKGMKQAAKTVDVVGTFSGARAGSMGFGSKMEEQVDEQKKTNQKLDKLNERTRVERGIVATEA